jgi:multicomponent Na+:H+ antiporter subunit A
MLLLLATLVLVGGAGLAHSDLWWPRGTRDIREYEAGVVVLMALAALVAIRAGNLLTAIVALGVVGYAEAFIYVLFGAPDLAMTQIVTQTLTLILFVLVFYRLPGPAATTPPRRSMRVAFGVATGILVAGLMSAAQQGRLAPSISGFFLVKGRPEAHGRNIVNLILVDFRALDTLGEMLVLATSAIGVLALLQLRPKDGRTS